MKVVSSVKLMEFIFGVGDNASVTSMQIEKADLAEWIDHSAFQIGDEDKVFQVGDRVRCAITNGCPNQDLILGNVYVVEEIFHPGEKLLKLQGIDGRIRFFRLEHEREK